MNINVSCIGGVEYDSQDNAQVYITIRISGLGTEDHEYGRNFYYEAISPGGSIVTGSFDIPHRTDSYSTRIYRQCQRLDYKIMEGLKTKHTGSSTITYPPLKWKEWNDLASNNIIQSETEGISATSWNRFIDEIIDLRKYLGVNPYETELNAIKANSGDLITAKAYNTARYYIGRTDDSETKDVIAGEDIITADHFKKLAADFNKYI